MATKPLPPSKLSQVRAAYERGDYAAALRIAAKFPDLGTQDIRDAIQRGHQAYARPDFVREIGRCPEVDAATGVRALEARYKFNEPGEQS